MFITFWGVRGSVPSPGPNTIYYGGNTTCLTVETNKTFIIIDSGTGIINVGSYVQKKKFKTLHILFSHYHWDHLQGLPFFNQIFNPDIHIDMYGKKNIQEIMSLQMKQPFFPADYKNLPSKIIHKKMNKVFQIEDITIKTIENNHPNGCVGMKIQQNNKSFAFITDNELFPPEKTVTKRQDFVDFIKGCTYLIHDAQYTEEDIKYKKGWGHSTFNQAIELGIDSNIPNIILTHHDPMRKDRELKNIIREKIKFYNLSNIKLNAAREFMTFEL